jgi:aldehyde:ferredoxin oxidoreductase
MAFQEGDLGKALAAGPAGYADKMGFYDDLNTKAACHMYPHGATQHNYDEGQVGSLMHLAFNRDPASQWSSRWCQSSGLPFDKAKAIAEQLFGGPWRDAYGTSSPMTPTKAKVAALGVQDKLLNDSLTLCGRPFSIQISPLKERGYAGDLTIQAQMYSAVTGDTKSFDELNLCGNRMATLLRAINMRDMNAMNQRPAHDIVPEYMFADFNGVEAFTKEGKTLLDRDDWETAKDMFYEAMGWDKTTGAPTRARLEKLGMKEVADELDASGLLPA